MNQWSMAQRDGRAPRLLLAGSPLPTDEITISRFHFHESAHVEGTPDDHGINFNLGSPTVYHCRIGSDRLSHVAPIGSMSMTPACVDHEAETEGSAEVLSLRISRGLLSLASADERRDDGWIAGMLRGTDRRLLEFALSLATEAAAGFSNGRLHCATIVDGLLLRLSDGYLTERPRIPGGIIDPSTIHRIDAFIDAHLAEDFDTTALANVARQSRFHFSRAFHRTTGMSPHGYVMRTRLARAKRLIREQRLALVEIASVTGFADQSHLSRWCRRIYGVSPLQLRN